MEGMIFAAGLGTRLYPLTKNKPKALVEINDKPMLEWLIKKMKAHGITRIVINIHHFGRQIIDFIQKNHSFGIDIQFSDEREKLLDTGGGLKKAASLLPTQNCCLLHNADILSDIDFSMFLAYHKTNNALSTLAVQKRPSSRQLLFDDEKYLCGWKNNKTGEMKTARTPRGKVQAFSFSGIHAVKGAIFPLITETGIFSIIDVYLRLAAKYKISFYEHTSDYWIDLGKPGRLKQAQEEFQFHF